MCKSVMNFLKTLVLGALFFSMNSFAKSLPDELLNAPIHLMSGEEVSLADYKGKKPVYLKFWATWCVPCRSQMPHFEHVQKEYGDKIEVIAINLGLNDDVESIQETIEEFSLSMPMAIDNDGDLAQKFRLIGTPYHLLFDKNMNLIHQGHDADESIDNKLALVAQSNTSDIIDSGVLMESEPDINVDVNDGKLHALFFTATWCDWYLKDSRPESSNECISAQHKLNELSEKYPDVSWLGIVSRLWTGEKDLTEYMEKFSVKYKTEIDKSNRLFYQHTINDLPTLVFIKSGKTVGRVSDFDDEEKLLALLNNLEK